MAEEKSLVVKSAVGDYIHGKNLKASSDLFDAGGISDLLKQLLDRACKRAEENGRKTVMKQDI